MKHTVALKQNHEFRRLYNKGKSAASPFFAVYCRKTGRPYSRLGLTTGVKLGNAVKRNRVRRRMRELYRTNDRTAAEGEKTLSDLLARRDCCRGQLGIWRNFLSCASATVSRRTVGEIKIRSAVPVKDFQKQVDQGAKELRQLEERIQELNWTTELLEG